MRKLLPILLTVIILLFVSLKVLPGITYAQPTLDDGTSATASGWVKDDEVSFVGKTASRSGDFLDWTLQNYSWLCVTKISANQCDNSNNPLVPFWQLIMGIVYAVIALFVLATAFIMIITRGQNITVMRFIPRFVFVVVLIYFSFSLVLQGLFSRKYQRIGRVFNIN